MEAFKDKVVLVTGGSRGIGKATVQAFAAAGARVTFTYRARQEDAERVAAETGATCIQCDQCNEEQIISVIGRVCEESGPIDVLVNNAGITADQFTMLMPTADWMRVMDTNINGVFRWSKTAMRSMLEKMAFRRGIGDVLAEGIVAAAEHFGQAAEEYAYHVKGMPMAEGALPSILANQKGAALGASVGAGYFSSFNEAFAQIKVIDTVEPSKKDAAAYQEAYTRWETFLKAQMA